MRENGPTITADPITGRATEVKNGVTRILPTIKMNTGTQNQYAIKIINLSKQIHLDLNKCQLTRGCVGSQDQPDDTVGPGLVSVWITPMNENGTGRKSTLALH